MAPNEPSAPRRRRSSLASPVAHADASRVTASLAQHIEHERIELMQIHAMIRCLYDVLLYSDDDDASLHADVAQVIARLLDESVARLDVLRMRVAQLEMVLEESAASSAPPPPSQVRELRVSYLC